jgi:8-oxo-dGTP pyrophosphatase MutT (NUDIX family)
MLTGQVTSLTTEPVTPLPAASAILLRDDPFEVLMLRRHEKSSFVPNAWVFPGGIAEESDAELGDGSFVDTMRVTAVRETFEETGVWLGAPLAEAERKRRELLDQRIAFRDLAREAPIDLAQLVWTSRWITPAGIPKRFDTYFFLAIVGRDAIATAEQNEIVDVTWIHPSDALARHAAREMQMVFPTLRNLEALTGFSSAAAVLDARRGAIVEAVEPVLVNGKPTLR